MNLVRSVLLAGVATLLSTAAQAASLSAADGGSAMVSNGTGFASETVGATLKIGDKVMTAAGKSATITYPDGCSVTVNAGQVVTIMAASPCATAANTGEAGATAGTGVSPVVVVGGLALGGGVIAALASKKSPSSP